MTDHDPILVVGGSGFLGRALVGRLRQQGHQVVSASRNGEYRVDAASKYSVAKMFREVKPFTVYHLTSESKGTRELDNMPATFDNDLTAAFNLLLATAMLPREPGRVRFIMAASLEEPEGDALPLTPYAAAKLASTMYGRMFKAYYGVDVRICRLMMTYGPGQKDFKVIPSTINTLLRDQPMRIGSGTRKVDWVYLDDVIDGLIAAGQIDHLDDIVDLGTGRLVTVGEVAREIARQLGKEHLLEIGEGARGTEVVRAADTESARARLGFRAKTSLADGLAATIAWHNFRRLADQKA
jgi:nucleoside-diphosphate-sugar epimerase